MFKGAMTAMVTPFRGSHVDYDRLTRNVQFQIENGIDGLVPVGTTGESPTLSHEEHRKVIEHVVKAAAEHAPADRKIPVIAGTGSNATSEALELTRHAKAVGADAALMVNPYYNKPSQEGLYRHFVTVADAVDLPIVLYNIPGRTNITMSPQTIARLAPHPNIAAVKEATGSMDIASQIARLCDTDPTHPDDGPPERPRIDILSGDDSLTLPLIAIGACGVISVVSNLVPDRVKAMVDAALAGDFATARQLHLNLFDLFNGMFTETNPIPIKTAMAMCNRDSGQLRLPLCEMSPENTPALEKLLKAHNLLPA